MEVLLYILIDLGYGTRDCAYQGAKSVGYSSSVRICYGHIKPSSIPKINNLISVESVKISFRPHICGQDKADRTLVFRVALDNNEVPSMTGTFNYTLRGGVGTTVQTVTGGSGSDLAQLIYTFLTQGKQLMLYNGETSIVRNPTYYDGSGYGSRNYAAIETFSIDSLSVKYRP